MVASFTVRGHPTITAPSGWSLVRSDSNGNVMTLATYERVAGSSESAAYTWSFSSSQAAAGGIVAYGGVDTRSPIVASGGRVTVDLVTAITAPSLSATGGGQVVLGLFGISTSTSISAPIGLSEHVDVASSAGTYKATMELSDLTAGSAGPTGDKVATAGNHGANIGQLVILRAA